MPYSGINNVPVDSYVVPHTQGAIGVRIISDDDTASSIGCSEWYGAPEDYLFLPRTVDNRSFVKCGDESFGLTDFYKSVNDDIGGNFTIRVVANVQLGDADKNGDVNIKDPTTIQKYAAHEISLTEENLDIADVNKDGEVNISDSTQIQKYLAKITASLS